MFSNNARQTQNFYLIKIQSAFIALAHPGKKN